MKEEEEEWRPVNGYEGVYEVSDLGNVRRLYREYDDANGVRRSRPGWDLKPWRQRGRRKVELRRPERPRRQVYVYRLVARAFVPNPEGKREVNHVNGVCDDDRAENLEWTTPAENKAHAVRLGLMRGPGLRGEAHPNAKLTADKVRQMRALAATDPAAAVALGESFGVTRQSARSAIDGRTWKHVR